ncbi:unnamed protein product [Darwinula stevensoni]|uniref:Uncharacterized protein n=1 Tax=Darwinula stevensoni TaxID=69355 RepID=A0A7R8XDR9_9CRUS|nr:unnamed protein product [Darwinula stevensoni]CAG0888883.1 unnamed protein product [Darwinula stevensoni]
MGVVARVKCREGWEGIGVICYSNHHCSFHQVLNETVYERDYLHARPKGRPKERVKEGVCGGAEDQVYLFKGRKTFMAKLSDDPSWSPPTYQNISSIDGDSSPFAVTQSTCLIPCSVPGKRFYLFGGELADPSHLPKKALAQGDGTRSQSVAGMFILGEVGRMWLPLPAFPRKIANAAGTSLDDGSILILGGKDLEKNETLQTAYIFDFRDGGRYSILPDIPQPIQKAAAMAWKETQIILAGGITADMETSSQVMVFDLKARKWEASCDWPSFHTPRSGLGLMEDTHGRLVALGGDNFGPVGTLEVLEEGVAEGNLHDNEKPYNSRQTWNVTDYLGFDVPKQSLRSPDKALRDY